MKDDDLIYKAIFASIGGVMAVLFGAFGGAAIADKAFERACLYDNRFTINGHEFICVLNRQKLEQPQKMRAPAPKAGVGA